MCVESKIPAHRYLRGISISPRSDEALGGRREQIVQSSITQQQIEALRPLHGPGMIATANLIAPVGAWAGRPGKSIQHILDRCELPYQAKRRARTDYVDRLGRVIVSNVDTRSL